MSKKEVYMIRLSTGERIDITSDDFVIGKSSKADYQIKGNSKISRVHVRIKVTDEGCTVEDLDSLNHTYVEGRMIFNSEPIENQQVIQLADEEFGFVIENAAEEEYVDMDAEEGTVSDDLAPLYAQLGRAYYDSTEEPLPNLIPIYERIKEMREAPPKKVRKPAAARPEPKRSEPVKPKPEPPKPKVKAEPKPKPYNFAPEPPKSMNLSPEPQNPVQLKADQPKPVSKQSQGRFCSNCGKKLRDGALFCRQCGTPADEG